MIKEVVREFSGILIWSSIPDRGYYYYIIFLDTVKSGLLISELLKNKWTAERKQCTLIDLIKES